MHRARVRSYSAVLDSVERRIYRIDRWRLPIPQGIAVRAVAYAIAVGMALAFAARFPIIDLALQALPPAIRLVGLPVGAGAALASWHPDGRAPHWALRSALRYLVSAHAPAGLRPSAAVGRELAPIHAISVAPNGDESCYRRGIVRGPAAVSLRYPAVLRIDRAPTGAWQWPAALSTASPKGLGARARCDCATAAARGRDSRVQGRGHRVQLRAPHHFIHGNLCFRTATEAWAGFRLRGESYPGLSARRKLELRTGSRRSPTRSGPTSS